MKTKTVAADSLIPYIRNPRKNSAAVDKVAASIKEYGWQQPIVVDKENVIIAGHTRLLAAQKLGMDKVPVHVADLSDAQAKAYRLADNRISEDADWDIDLLGLELRELDDLGFDLDLTGFDNTELANLLIDPDLGETDEDAVPEPPEEPISNPGDLWILGEHRLLCGDSTNLEDVERLMDGNRPELLVTDPPYGVNYDANWRNEAKRPDGTPYGASALGKVNNDDRADWTEAYRLWDGNVAYVWHAGTHSHLVGIGLADCGLVLRNLIIWGKNQHAISRGNYHHKHEPCWYAVRKGESAGWIGDRSQTTLWEIDKPRKSETGHSTQKPIECMETPLKNHLGNVYDPFLGSGTTIIAAERLGRKCYGMELDPKYCDVIVKRWEQYTSEQATLQQREAA